MIGYYCFFHFIDKKTKEQRNGENWEKDSSVQFSLSAMSDCDPMDRSLPGSSVHRIFQARVLEWGAIAFSNSQYIWLQISNQPTIVNLISKYESFIHLGCFLGIFYVQFILLRTPWNRKGTSLPPDNEQAEVAHGWWNLLQGPCFHPQDCEDPDSLLSTLLLASQCDWPEPLQM